MVKAKMVFMVLMLAAGMTAAAAQETQLAKQPSRLLTGKLIAVTPMPGDFDRWITQDLRAWNRYNVLPGDAEGVDLVVRGDKPEKPTQFRERMGVEQPKRERPGPAVLSVTVIDWVANQPVWHATIRDKKPKKDEEIPTGPDIEIDAQGLKPMELAALITREFRLYVEQLEKAAASKQ
ncbi:MAG: hypothetical protein ACLQOO_12770 [Terriglobia bacterium]